jgi:hypothetical protein
MSPFEIAPFIVSTSLIIAILRGPSGMLSTEAADLAIASLVQAIVAADVGLIASATAVIGAANRIFILFLPWQPLAKNNSQGFQKPQFRVVQLATF